MTVPVVQPEPKKGLDTKVEALADITKGEAQWLKDQFGIETIRDIQMAMCNARCATFNLEGKPQRDLTGLLGHQSTDLGNRLEKHATSIEIRIPAFEKLVGKYPLNASTADPATVDKSTKPAQQGDDKVIDFVSGLTLGVFDGRLYKNR